MAKLHTRGKGKSGSRKVKKPTKWLEITPEEVKSLVIKLRKEGKNTSNIGRILRDQYGIPSVKKVCKKSISKIIEEELGKVKYPEDLSNLMKKAINLRDHLEKNKGDMRNKRNLTNIESKIRRLVKYYTRVGKLPKDWKYKPEVVRLEIK